MNDAFIHSYTSDQTVEFVMETIAIKSHKPFSLDHLKDTLSKHWPVEISAHGALVVHGADSRAYVEPGAESENDDLFELQINYSDVELAKAVLRDIADDPELIVDNDFDTVLTGSEFVARCKAEPDWDWRKKS